MGLPHLMVASGLFAEPSDPQIMRYGAVATLASVLEAFSVQNDNLILPLYMWSMLAFVNA